MLRRRFNSAGPLFLAGIAAIIIAMLWLAEARVGRLWLRTAWLAAGACVVAIPLGTLLATLLVKTDVAGRRPALLLLVALLFVPLYLVMGAWDAGFGIQGWHTLVANPHLAHEPWLAGWRAAIWVHGLAAVPWVALIVGAGLRTVEAEFEEDAVLCTSPPRVLWHVSLPRAATAILVAAGWVAIIVSAEISVTDFFQVRTFAEEIYTQSALGAFTFSDAPPEPEDALPLSALGLWLGLALSTVIAVAALLAARTLVADLVDTSNRPPWIWRLRRARWPTTILLWSIMFLVAGVPLANLVYKAGVRVDMTEAGRVRSWSPIKVVERVAAAPVEYRGQIWQSIQIGGAATTAALLIGAPLAWSMRLARSTPWLRLIALAICLTIPGPLLGIAVIRALNQPDSSPLAFLSALYDSNFAPWLVQTIRTLPWVTLILWSAFASVPQVMLDMAATDGAGWWRQLLWIALPQHVSAVVAAWLLGLAIAVGELASTVLVMPPARHTVLAVQVFQLLHYGVDDRLAAVCLVMALGIGAIVALAATLMKPKTSI